MAIGGKTAGILSGMGVGVVTGVLLAAMNPILPQEDVTRIITPPDRDADATTKGTPPRDATRPEAIARLPDPTDDRNAGRAGDALPDPVPGPVASPDPDPDPDRRPDPAPLPLESPRDDNSAPAPTDEQTRPMAPVATALNDLAEDGTDREDREGAKMILPDVGAGGGAGAGDGDGADAPDTLRPLTGDGEARPRLDTDSGAPLDLPEPQAETSLGRNGVGRGGDDGANGGSADGAAERLALAVPKTSVPAVTAPIRPHPTLPEGRDRALAGRGGLDAPQRPVPVLRLPAGGGEPGGGQKGKAQGPEEDLREGVGAGLSAPLAGQDEPNAPPQVPTVPRSPDPVPPPTENAPADRRTDETGNSQDAGGEAGLTAPQDSTEKKTGAADERPAPADRPTAGANAPAGATTPVAPPRTVGTLPTLGSGGGSRLPTIGAEPSQTAALDPVSRFPTIGDGLGTAALGQEQGRAQDAASDPGALVRNALPFDGPQGPLISLVVRDDGTAVERLDTLRQTGLPLTIAIAVDGPQASRRARILRNAGFEILAVAPDDVALSLSGNQSEHQIAELLDQFFTIIPDAIGLMDRPVANIQKDRRLARHVVSRFAETGHGVVTYGGGLNAVERLADARSVPSGAIYRILDAQGETGPVIGRYLNRAAFEAKSKGRVIVLSSSPDPATLAAFRDWASGTGARDVTVAPLSATLRSATGG